MNEGRMKTEFRDNLLSFINSTDRAILSFINLQFTERA